MAVETNTSNLGLKQKLFIIDQDFVVLLGLLL